MLNSVVSIGEICPEPRPLVAPPHRQLVLSSQLASCCVLVRLWVLLADCRSVSLLPPPLALSLLVSPSHYSSDSGLLFAMHPLPPSLTVLLSLLCAPARFWADWGPLAAIDRHSWASVRIFF